MLKWLARLRTLGRAREPADRAAVGARGERMALWFLRLRGFRLVARNFFCPEGELDLIMRRGPLLVIVEVRTVTQNYLACPLDSVDGRKRARVRRAAQRFLELAAPPHGDVRIDLVGVSLRGWLGWRIVWRKDAFPLRPRGARGRRFPGA